MADFIQLTGVEIDKNGAMCSWATHVVERPRFVEPTYNTRLDGVASNLVFADGSRVMVKESPAEVLALLGSTESGIGLEGVEDVVERIREFLVGLERLPDAEWCLHSVSGLFVTYGDLRKLVAALTGRTGP